MIRHSVRFLRGCVEASHSTAPPIEKKNDRRYSATVVRPANCDADAGLLHWRNDVELSIEAKVQSEECEMRNASKMRSHLVNGARSCLLLGAILISEGAQAQTPLQRCNTYDSLNEDLAELRLKWARRCAIQNLVDVEGLKEIDTGDVDADHAPLIDYLEPMRNGNQDLYSDPSEDGAVNGTVRKYLYQSGPTYARKDCNGCWAWGKLPSLRKVMPLYPMYGSESSIFSATWRPLYPHPELADCNLYYDREGKSRAGHFYNNGYCPSS